MDRPGVLVFSRTADYRHDSIPAATEALARLADADGLHAAATEDPADLSPERLARAAAVVFVSTSGEVLDRRAHDALQAYVRAGGGFLGIHGASASNYGWPWYQALVGAAFTQHPAEQAADVVREDARHPATSALPDRWRWTDEWYDFQASPRAHVRVLLSVDETTYEGGGMGDHPISWCHDFEGGRSFYTALGHSIASWSDPLLLAHVRGALRWVAGR
ncbi:MAG TPA: ThuA domain-containing protein [Anaeromyxobacter sp.]|nr:ThuA domain-containing protein [Anaeromyxobacter sp.]